MQYLKLQTLHTDQPKEKQDLAVFSSLLQNIHECIRHLLIADIGWAEGLKLITDKMNWNIFMRPEHKCIHGFQGILLQQKWYWDKYKCLSVWYEFLYQKLINFGMKLPNGLKAFFVLNAANLSKENEKLWRTTCASFNYTTMKETLKKVFSDIL